MSVLAAGLEFDELEEARASMRPHMTALRAAPREETTMEEQGRKVFEAATARRDTRGVAFLEELVRLAMEAYDRAAGDIYLRAVFEAHARECMAQAAQVYAFDVGLAEELGATRTKEAVLRGMHVVSGMQKALRAPGAVDERLVHAEPAWLPSTEVA